MEITDNQFDQKLDNALSELKSCQEKHQVQSCYECSECVGCDIRSLYVRAVYESMSKGEIGGFDF